MKDYQYAIEEAKREGVDFSRDFFAQNVGGICAELARKFGYRKPKNANGSTGRYFFARLQRDRYRGGINHDKVVPLDTSRRLLNSI